MKIFIIPDKEVVIEVILLSKTKMLVRTDKAIYKIKI
jgi:hypothetical protein